MEITELSEIDILQLQFKILEELKQKKTKNNSNQEMDAIKFISKRVKDKDGIYESDKYYYYRQTWFEHGCCSYRELGNIVGKSHVNMQQIAKRYKWQIIKKKAFELGYTPHTQSIHYHDDHKDIDRTSKQYRRYHEKILRRDKVCQCCGSSENLEVHHPLPFKKYNSLAADINNGIVLCKECHTEYHSQNGYKKNCNPVSLAQFLRDYAKPFQSTLQPPSPDIIDSTTVDIGPKNWDQIVHTVHGHIKSFQKEYGMCSKEQIISAMKKEISEEEVMRIINSFIQKGVIYSPQIDQYKSLSY